MPRVTLTFDNGPVPGVTERVLRSLDRFGIAATFFVIGRRLDEPEAETLLQNIQAGGHWIGNHTLTHTVAFGDRPDADYAAREIGETEARLARFACRDPLFRPYGNDGLLGPHLFSRAALAILLDGGYTTVLWTCVPGDWRDPEGWVERCLDQVRGQARPVIVLHDIPGACADRLDELLGRMVDQGVTFEQDFPDAVIATRGGRTVSLDPTFLSD